jgi:hypothetical protein
MFPVQARMAFTYITTIIIAEYFSSLPDLLPKAIVTQAITLQSSCLAAQSGGPGLSVKLAVAVSISSVQELLYD